MKILNIQAHRGPNIWSTTHPNLIQLRLELEKSDLKMQDPEPAHLKDVIPGLSIEGEEPIHKAEAVAIIALCLQRHAGIQAYYSCHKPTIEANISNSVFEYVEEQTGKLVAEKAVQILKDILNQKPIDFAEHIRAVKKFYQQNKLDSFADSVVKQAKNRDIPFIIDLDEKTVQLGYGKYGKHFSTKAVEGKYPPVDQTPGQFLSRLFPEGRPNRIPIIAITGTNGKTTTSRLIAHILQENGKNVGFTTSDGIYIGAEMVDKGDTTGPVSAQRVLSDTTVDIAVLECARGGIVRAGLGFDKCDISIVTNIHEDHIGLSDINTLEELANAKGIIVDVLKNDGIAICNAENEYAKMIGERCTKSIAWFALKYFNPHVKELVHNNERVCTLKDEQIILFDQGEEHVIAHVHDIPITFEGRVEFMVQNVMAASMACYYVGIKPKKIAKALKTFFPGVEQTPGRLNIFEFSDFKIMIDFAHNPDGFKGIRDFMATIESPYKIGIITGTGDRRDSDMKELGSLSAQMFDHIIISQRKFLRGRTAEEIVNSIISGILEQNPEASYEYISDEIDLLQYALTKRVKDCFICALSDVLEKPLEAIPKLMLLEKKGKL